MFHGLQLTRHSLASLPWKVPTGRATEQFTHVPCGNTVALVKKVHGVSTAPPKVLQNCGCGRRCLVVGLTAKLAEVDMRRVKRIVEKMSHDHFLTHMLSWSVFVFVWGGGRLLDGCHCNRMVDDPRNEIGSVIRVQSAETCKFKRASVFDVSAICMPTIRSFSCIFGAYKIFTTMEVLVLHRSICFAV